MTGDSASPEERELLDAQRAWLAHESDRRQLSDRRIRAVWAAVDQGGMSHSEVARVMSRAGKPVDRPFVTKMLGWGYPE